MATEVGQSYNQPSASPTTKVTAGLLAGAITTVVVFLLSLIGLVIPTLVAQAITVIVGFVVSYYVKESPVE